jgi:16S rRNA (adenine1518-N6/adenine1519-N6)-dimethyltransferase
VSTTSTDSSSRRNDAPSVPHRPNDVARTLERLGISPSKRLGQSFLWDSFVADAEAALVADRAGPRIVEVGGGLGVLTEALLRRGLGPITIVERDPRLAEFLASTFGEKVRVVVGDALDVDLPPMDVLVGNLPFSVATPILERVWAERVPRFVGMLQREVVDRLVSPPGSRVYGRLTIVAAYHGTVEPFQVVPSSAFFPAPAVEGRVVSFDRRSGPSPVPTIAPLESLLDALFSARRKQLRNLLPRALPPGADAEQCAEAAEWPDDWALRRPEALAPEAFFRMATVLASLAGRATSPPLPRQP